MEQKEEKKAKKSFFKSVKAEFKKIVWPTKDTVKKETTAVVLWTAALGAIIALLDAVIKMGVSFLNGLGV
ncbi:MAG: preprotein translocase subunit SecE [Lachnospiraceae bacterium]|nr:preprotein translocase subunit SecE [Lachnospiraceae bacterium]MBQ3967662.1 preprotein translocase subunit SecE [Lachnospiraceae bacterium]